MQYHSCVSILGHAEPQNCFSPGVGEELYSNISDQSAFLGQLLYILTFYFQILVRKYKTERKKKKKNSRPFLIFWVGQKRANKHLFFFFFFFFFPPFRPYKGVAE